MIFILADGVRGEVWRIPRGTAWADSSSGWLPVFGLSQLQDLPRRPWGRPSCRLGGGTTIQKRRVNENQPQIPTIPPDRAHSAGPSGTSTRP